MPVDMVFEDMLPSPYVDLRSLLFVSQQAFDRFVQPGLAAVGQAVLADPEQVFESFVLSVALGFVRQENRPAAHRLPRFG